jgi:tRNA(His) guanylyltransferase
MSSRDSLGDRMKSYEDSYRISLPIRSPVIIRVDGKAFHTYTKNCKRPLDAGLIECMNDTAKELCKTVQGCQLAYVQSDEISLLLTNYSTLDTQSWFDNNIQKMVSVSASVASVTFTTNSYKIWGETYSDSQAGDLHVSPIIKPAYFDSRAFIIPREDVCNYFLWRQQDATRNSVQMLARSLYSHKQCTDKNNSELQEMIFQKGINWNDCPISQKRGRCVTKQQVSKKAVNPKTNESVVAMRSEWVVDVNIPVFSQDRRYIDRLVYPEREKEFTLTENDLVL